MDNKDETINMLYNKIMNYICSLESFNLEELEKNLATDKGINYKKIELFVLQAVLYIVFAGGLKIVGNRFIKTEKKNIEIDDDEKMRLLNILEENSNNIYLDDKNVKSRGR